jgi:hypothetical protein
VHPDSTIVEFCNSMCVQTACGHARPKRAGTPCTRHACAAAYRDVVNEKKSSASKFSQKDATRAFITPQGREGRKRKQTRGSLHFANSQTMLGAPARAPPPPPPAMGPLPIERGVFSNPLLLYAARGGSGPGASGAAPAPGSCEWWCRQLPLPTPRVAPLTHVRWRGRPASSSLAPCIFHCHHADDPASRNAAWRSAAGGGASAAPLPPFVVAPALLTSPRSPARTGRRGGGSPPTPSHGTTSDGEALPRRRHRLPAPDEYDMNGRRRRRGQSPGGRGPGLGPGLGPAVAGGGTAAVEGSPHALTNAHVRVACACRVSSCVGRAASCLLLHQTAVFSAR